MVIKIKFRIKFLDFRLCMTAVGAPNLEWILATFVVKPGKVNMERPLVNMFEGFPVTAVITKRNMRLSKFAAYFHVGFLSHSALYGEVQLKQIIKTKYNSGVGGFCFYR